MAGGLDEVQARVNTVVHNFLTVDATFLFEVSVKSRLNVFDDGLPT